MNIDDMQPGRELNHAVARAMGWRIGDWGGVPVFEIDGKGWPEFNPSEKMGDAWMVAEPLAIGVLPAIGDGGFVAGYEGRGACHWFENYTCGMPDDLRTWCEAPTAPLAICRAVLRLHARRAAGLDA